MINHFIINVFIISYLYFAWFWSSSDQSLWNKTFRPVYKYIKYLGLRHKWNMFSPPVKYDVYIFAIIFLEDGQQMNWNGIQLDKLNNWEAFKNMRARGYQRRLFNNTLMGGRAALADYLVRLYTLGASQPVKVEVYADYQEVTVAEVDQGIVKTKQCILLYRWLKKG